MERVDRPRRGPRRAITELKARHREVHVIGSLDLLQSLLGADLVDQLYLWVYPVVLGCREARVRAGHRPDGAHLDESVTYPGGSVNLVFSPAGRPSFGDMTAQ